MNDDTGLPDIVVTTKSKPKEKNKIRQIPPYHVILFNDDHHSMEFVVEVLCKTFGYSVQRSIEFMWEAHTTGRAVVWTGPKEVAELKVEQLTSFHEIRDNGAKLGPLGCTIEPA